MIPRADSCLYRRLRVRIPLQVDILITESVLSAGRLQQMRHRAPYSNILRPNTSRLRRPRRRRPAALTGLILVRAPEFYTSELRQAQVVLLAGGNATGNDEEFLAKLVTAAGFTLPPANETYRPAHGLHLSNSRGPHSRGIGRAMGIGASDARWCPVLDTPHFQEYFAVDEQARTILHIFSRWALCVHDETRRAVRVEGSDECTLGGTPDRNTTSEERRWRSAR